MSESSSSIYEYLASTASLTPGHFCHRKTGVVTIAGPVLHAVDGSKGAILLVPVSDSFSGLFPWSSKGLALDDKQLRIEGKVSRFVELSCIDRRLNRQFGLLVDDILEAIIGEPTNAGAIAIDIVERWRSLFERTKTGLLSESALIGLWGELRFLEEITAENHLELIQAWLGPFNDQHDFVFAAVSVEVKTTLGAGSFKVGIHGSRQLQRTRGKKLILRAYRLQRNSDGRSVPDLITRLLELGVSRIELFRRLSEIAYFDADASHYNEHKFDIIDLKNVLVDEKFPRITPETITDQKYFDSISNLNYSVEIGNIRSCEMDIGLLGLGG